jgi:hypothetical protein
VNPVETPEPTAVGFEGFGPVHYGATREAVEEALGHPLQGGDVAAGCAYLASDAVADGQPLLFMFDDGELRRIDVESPATAAEGGGRVGMEADEIRALYSGRVTELPNRLVRGGTYLVVDSVAGGETKLVFEVDPSGRVTHLRAGFPPYVQGTQGCS